MNKNEKAYLFCQKHYDNYLREFKNFNKFPKWWCRIPYWDDCYLHLTEKGYVKVNDDLLKKTRALVLIDLTNEYKDENAGTRMSKLPTNYFQTPEKIKYIEFLIKKKICIDFFKK